MATKTSTFIIPGYEYYEQEGTYVSPTRINKTTLSKIKNRKIGLKALNLFDL